jgi:hypothetical protein
MESQPEQPKPEKSDDDGPKPFACHICLDTASEPIVTRILDNA